MTTEEHIEWLIKEVNRLNDAICNCNNCNPPLPNNMPIPNINFFWGDADTYDTVLVDSGGDPTAYGVTVHKLGIKIDNYTDIAGYSPTLIIDRYRNKEPRRRFPHIAAPNHRSAGFKHENADDAISNGRVNEILISSESEIINTFRGDAYFRKGVKVSPYPSGFGQNWSNKSFINIGARQHLAFRMKLTKDGIDYYTPILQKLRVEIRGHKVTFKYE